jgi:hypothetical protein
MRRVFLLWLSALLPTLLWAHPEWKEASSIGVIDEKNTFALTVKFDVPSFLLGQLPKDAPVKELDVLMFTPGRLASSIEPGRQQFLAGLRLEADGKAVAWKIETFPTAEQILAQSSRQGEADRYPVMMNIKLTAKVPADTQKLVLRFPDALGTVFTNLRKGMELQTVMAVSKNEPGEFQIGDGSVAADHQTLYALLADGFGHVLPDGWDHCLFMLAMFLGAASLRQALGRSLVFTLGHSITLSGRARLGRQPGCLDRALHRAHDRPRRADGLPRHRDPSPDARRPGRLRLGPRPWLRRGGLRSPEGLG